MSTSYSIIRNTETRSATSHQSWGTLTWVANREISGAQLTLGRVTIRKGDHNPRHSHPNCEEVLYLLTGRLEHSAGDQKVVLEPGDAIRISAGVFHNAVNIGDVDADMIVAFSSGDRSFLREPSSEK